MKIPQKAKLLALIPLITLAFGCEAKEAVKENTSPKENPPAVKEVKKPSPLRLQIQLMLVGKAHSEPVIKAEIRKQEWKKTFAMLKAEIKSYTSQHGEKPEKKHIAITHARLSRINAQVDLENAKLANSQSLAEFEKAIQKAIEKEKAQKTSH